MRVLNSQRAHTPFVYRIFDIGDLISGQFLDVSIISQWRNIEIRPIRIIYESEKYLQFF